MRRWLLLLVLLLVAATVAVLVGRGDGEPARFSPAADQAASDVESADEASPEPDRVEVEPPVEATAAEPVSEPDSEPVEEEPDEEPEEWPPPDPIEKGPCTLRVAFYDAESQEPVRGEVELWRLDVPGNVDWSRGDQSQGKATADDEGAVFEELPEGRYRVVPLFARHDAEDPPAFEVWAPETEVRFPVEVPRTFKAWLVVVDDAGRPVERGRIRARLGYTFTGPPDWRTERRLLELGPDSRYFRGGGGLRGSSAERVVTAGPEGFEFGPFEEDQRGRALRHRPELRVRGKTKVKCRIVGDFDAPHHYLGVCIDEHFFDDVVYLPDGRRACDLPGGLVFVSCEAVPVEPDDPPDRWKEIPIQVWTMISGYSRLDFEYRLSDGMPPIRYLEPEDDTR